MLRGAIPGLEESMSEFKKSLALVLALGLAAPAALAQDTTAPATDAPATTAPAAEAPAAEVPATAAPAAPSAEGPGTTYIAKSIEAWELECIRTEDGKDPCQIVQVLKDPAGNKVSSISVLSLTNGGEAVAGATIATPLETLLTAGVSLQVDSQKAKLIPFHACDQFGCYANFAMTKAEVDMLRKGNKIAVKVVPAAAPDKSVDLEVSLKGFTAAFAEAEASMPKPAQ